MSDVVQNQDTHDIVIDEVFPHAPAAIWKALTSGDLINRWLMTQKGFAPVLGNKFSFQTPPSDDWDGVIHCEILELQPNHRLSYSWKSGVETAAGYVARLDTVVAWTLTAHDSGTRLQLVHSGFVMPKNETTFKNISSGWPRIIPKLIALVADNA
jgi:uncharacterized protein YndB with AHSA1/START domain